MASITWLGATYPNVDSIGLPKTEGGTATFYDADADFAWLGGYVEYLGEVYSVETALKDTSFNGWSPSTTAKTIVSSKSVSPTVSINLEQYEYAIRWKFDCPMQYSASATNKLRVVRCLADSWQLVMRRANSFVNITANNLAGNACATLLTNGLMDYYNSSGSHTYTWSVSYGIYPALTAATFANATNLQTTMTIKTPSVSARCSNSYINTTNMGYVDQTNTSFKIKGYLYRYKPQGIMCKLYQYVDRLYATPL